MMNNKLYYSFVALMFIAAMILLNRILSLEKMPTKKTFDVHLNMLDKAARKFRKDCYDHHKEARDRVVPTNPRMTKALAGLDLVITFGDSADFYFRRLESFKGDPDSARHCFAKYAQFSNRFTGAIHEITGIKIKEMPNYLLTIHEQLPAKKLPFESEQGIELLGLLLQIDFYERMQRAMDKLVTFAD
jgi:hypothetical protein